MDRFCAVCFPSGAQLCCLQAKDVTIGTPHPAYLLWHTAMQKGSLPNFDQKLYDGVKKTSLDTSSVETCTLLYGSELLSQPFFRENVLPVLFEDIFAPVVWII